MTHGPWPWKDLLRSLDAGVANVMLGESGVARFAFRLLQNTRDHNHMKVDSGERHVFELLRPDGLAWQMHFSKNGSLDPPTRVPAAATFYNLLPQVVEGNRLHLDPPAQASDIYPHATRSEPIGRKETHMALSAITQCAGAQAVDITDEIAFQWRRWLTNVVQAHELIGCGIRKVFAAHLDPTEPPQILFLRADDTVATMAPGRQQHGEYSKPEGTNRLLTDITLYALDELPLLHSAVHGNTPWIQARFAQFNT